MSVTITREQILETAVRQSAIDLHCAPEDFLCGENRVVCSEPSPDARRYLELPFLLNLVSYGNNVVASVSPAFESLARGYIDRFPAEHCFETPNLHVLNDALRKKGRASASWRSTFCPIRRFFLRFLAPMRPGFSRLPIFLRFICRSGAMHCAKSESAWTYWLSARMTVKR